MARLYITRLNLQDSGVRKLRWSSSNHE